MAASGDDVQHAQLERLSTNAPDPHTFAEPESRKECLVDRAFVQADDALRLGEVAERVFRL